MSVTSAVPVHGPRGPLRLGIGEKLVGGRIHQVLACGHSYEAVLDRDGLWTTAARSCGHCLQELRDGARPSERLADSEILAAIGTGDWDLTDEEKRAWVARAKNVWHYVRYGDQGVFSEREGTEVGQEAPSGLQGA